MNDNAITPEGLEALRAEIHELETTGRQEIAARIKTAREWGDLKENAEYHDAKNDQALMEAKINRLNDRLRSAVAVESTDQAEDGKVSFGSSVKLRMTASGREVEYTFVGSTEADAGAGKISSESPVAKAVIGARVGEKVKVQTPSGEQEFEIVSVNN